MNLNKTWRFLLNYPALFFLILVEIYLIYTAPYYPTLDGHAHIHNANIIKSIILDQDLFYSQFYSIQSIYLPNWIFYFITVPLLVFFSAKSTIFIAFSLYVVLSVFSFQYFIKQIAPKNQFLTLLIFPFLHTLLLHMGFYNHAFSFIFLFFGIGFWFKHHNQLNWKLALKMSVIVLLCYLSATLSFLYLGLCMVLIGFIKTKDDSISKNLSFQIKKLGVLFLICLPALILFGFFIFKTSFFSSDSNYTFNELLNWIRNIRILIVYTFEEESGFVKWLAIILAVLSTYVLVDKAGKFQNKFSFTLDFLLIPFLLSMLFLFQIPDGSSAGMMSFRFLNFSFVFLIMWLSLQKYHSIFISVLVLAFVMVHYKLINKRHDSFIKSLSERASEMYDASLPIPENTIVLPINLSDNWLESHLSSLLGADRKILSLENYESYLSWFPVQKKDKEFNYYTLSKQDYLDLIMQKKAPFQNVNQKVGAVCIFGDITKLDTDYEGASEFLKSNYHLVFHSKSDFVWMYLHN
jgi:hypothetical protein